MKSDVRSVIGIDDAKEPGEVEQDFSCTRAQRIFAVIGMVTVGLLILGLLAGLVWANQYIDANLYVGTK